MRTRPGFTLVEVLLALLILSVMSIAMIGTLATGTRLFRDGEMARAANDEAMAVLARFAGDLERAVPPASYRGGVAGGHCYAWARPGSADSVVGWTVVNPDPTRAPDVGDDGRLAWERVFVLWGRHSGDGTLRRAVLASAAEVVPPGSTARPAHLDSLLAQGSQVTDRCFHFSVWLAGTWRAGDAEPALVPKHDWQAMTTGGSGTVTAEPRAGDPPYATRAGDGYPGSLHLRLLLGGKGGTGKEGIVVAPVAADANSIRIAGIDGLPTAPGSVLLIGATEAEPLDYEIVGYGAASGGRIRVSGGGIVGITGVDAAGGDTDSGRGLFRSVAAEHPRGAGVRSCRQFNLITTLPR